MKRERGGVEREGDEGGDRGLGEAKMKRDGDEGE